MSQQSAIPAHAALLRDFVNTLDVETGEEALPSPETLNRWLSEKGLLASGVACTPDDREHALRLRETLRHALIGHHDGRRGDAYEMLDAECAAHPIRVAFRGEEPVLEPVAEGVRGALAHIVAAVVTSASDGTWQRLKVCPEETCQWAFLDTSKNRSRTWCSMRVCGNRSKTRSYRARQRTTGDTDRIDRIDAADPATDKGLPQ